MNPRMNMVRMIRPSQAVSGGLANGNLFADFDRLFSELAKPTQNLESFNYPVDLYETSEHLVLEMAVPGLRAEALDISVEDRMLTIKGSVTSETKSSDAQSVSAEGHQELGTAEGDVEKTASHNASSQDRHYWLQAISRSDFSRSLKLPKSVEIEAISAKVENGILYLNMPKSAEAKVKKIAINAA